MNLLWPWFLLFLVLIPLAVAFYIWVLRRRRRITVRYSSLSLVRQALPVQSRLRRHLPFALFLLAVTSLLIALTRPVAVVDVPVSRATIILAIDVSRSMCATDIPPNRLHVAQNAALSFIANQESGTQIGIVAFAGFAELVLPPTSDQELLEDTVANLTTARRTAIGSAILKSLDAIAELNASVAPSDSANDVAAGITPVPDGTYVPDIIVLLTDGASNQGPMPLEAAQQAVERGVRVYTIGFGKVLGTPMMCTPQQTGGEQFGTRFGFGGGGFRSRLDEPTLQGIASRTGGDYYLAESADELQDVFLNLPAYFITTTETREISVVFVAIGALLAAMAMLLSQLWHPLP